MPTNVQAAADFSQMVKKSLKENLSVLHFPFFRGRLLKSTRFPWEIFSEFLGKYLSEPSQEKEDC